MIVVGHVALIQRTKKQDFVIRVLAELKKRDCDVIGLFPGECREPEYMDELRKLVDDLSLEENVLFLGRRNDIPDLLKLIDVLIIPSSFEGFPLAGLEAAAAGVPVVACNVAGAREFVDVSRGGVTFVEDDVNQAVTAILDCCEKETVYSKNGRRFADSCSTREYKKSITSAFVGL